MNDTVAKQQYLKDNFVGFSGLQKSYTLVFKIALRIFPNTSSGGRWSSLDPPLEKAADCSGIAA